MSGKENIMKKYLIMAGMALALVGCSRTDSMNEPAGAERSSTYSTATNSYNAPAMTATNSLSTNNASAPDSNNR
jgi:hypothetical protein